MKKGNYSVSEIKKSLQKIEVEIIRLNKLTRGIPGVQKNIAPILSFIDILEFHLGELTTKKRRE